MTIGFRSKDDGERVIRGIRKIEGMTAPSMPLRRPVSANSVWVRITGGPVGDLYDGEFVQWSEADQEWLLEDQISFTFTAANATEIYTAEAHGLANGQLVRVSSAGVLPAGLTADTDYYIIAAADNTFQLSLTVGGAAVPITTDGTGVHTCQTVPDFIDTCKVRENNGGGLDEGQVYEGNLADETAAGETLDGPVLSFECVFSTSLPKSRRSFKCIAAAAAAASRPN